MGWRPSTDLDVVLAVLVTEGPASISEVAKKIDPEVWERIYSAPTYATSPSTGERVRLPSHRAAPSIGYQGIYIRLKQLERTGRVVRQEKGKNGAWLWRPTTVEERLELEAEQRASQEPSSGVMARFYKLEKEMGVKIIYECEPHPQGDWWRRALVVRTARGDAHYPLKTNQSWEEALVDAGLE
jgi:hypothetical protein